MTTTPTAIDPGTAMALIMAGAVGADAAGILAPYAVILIAAVTGSGWALSRRKPTARISAIWFVSLMVMSTTLVTAGLAQLAARMYPSLETQWTLAPIALVVSGIGDDWPAVGQWLINLLGSVIQRRAQVTQSTTDEDHK